MEQNEETTRTQSQDSTAQSSRKVGRTIAIVLGVLLFVALVGGAVYGLVTHPQATASVRDISIIALALVTIFIGLLLAVLMYQLQSLIALLRNEIKPILESVNDTTNTVRGTTTFVSERMVTPIIAAASYTTAIRETISLLFGGKRKRRSKESS